MYIKEFVLYAHLEVHDEVVSVRRLGRVLNALLRCTRVTLCYILANRSLKQDGFLTHITNLKNEARPEGQKPAIQAQQQLEDFHGTPNFAEKKRVICAIIYARFPRTTHFVFHTG